MITKYFIETSMGDLELKDVTSMDQAKEYIRAQYQGSGTYLVMERHYVMKSERATTVDTGEV